MNCKWWVLIVFIFAIVVGHLGDRRMKKVPQEITIEAQTEILKGTADLRETDFPENITEFNADNKWLEYLKTGKTDIPLAVKAKPKKGLMVNGKKLVRKTYVSTAQRNRVFKK